MSSFRVQLIIGLVLLTTISDVESQSTPVCNVITLNTDYPKDWNYANQAGWTNTNFGTNACGASNTQQSPIDLAIQNVLLVNPPTQITLKSVPLSAQNSQNNITLTQAKYTINMTTKNSVLYVPQNASAVSFTLEYIEYRSPAEHTINGQRFDGEFHLVYGADNQWCNLIKRPVSTVVIPFLSDPQADNNPFLNTLASFANGTQSTMNLNNFNVRQNLTSYVNSNQASYIHYSGSLDVPPCSPIVEWYVLSIPLLVQPNITYSLQNFLIGNQNKATFDPTLINSRNLQQIPGIVLDKGSFTYYEDDEALRNMVAGDDTYAWTAVWAWPIGLGLILLLSIIIYGLYKVSSNDRHKLLLEKQSNNDNAEVKYEMVPLDQQTKGAV